MSKTSLPVHLSWNGLNRFWTSTPHPATNEPVPAAVGGEYIFRSETGAQETWYKISNYDRMPPFFISLVIDSNHWVYISTNGGLTCGRISAEHSLFPYYTVDKIHDSHTVTGPKTLLQVTLRRGESDEDYARLVDQGGETSEDSKAAVFLWEPFVKGTAHNYKIARNIYKNAYGNKLQFEEINEDLGLQFTYSWTTSDEFGFIRECHLTNLKDQEVQIRILDGLQNLLPSGVTQALQEQFSSLVDAYKWSELDAAHQLGIYCLYAQLSDKAEPKESLRANTVWHAFLPITSKEVKAPASIPSTLILLSNNQIDTFRGATSSQTFAASDVVQDGILQQETLMKGQRGAYFVSANVTIPAHATQQWVIIAEVDQTQASIATLTQKLPAYPVAASSVKQVQDLLAQVNRSIEAGTQKLKMIIASADGLQCTGDLNATTHHYANVMFNVMRGGIFDHHYDISKQDFTAFLKQWNHKLAKQFKTWCEELPEVITYPDLLARAKAAPQTNSDSGRNLIRLCMEYLPLTFSRRHGDPSRPWNKFAIHLKNSTTGERILSYQGNWRDIFQNWEALVFSYPEYILGFIAKFVNATTVDGFNPYHVSRDGIQWEKPSPTDPWANIGYWGDHQIIYLLKFLEFAKQYCPVELGKLLDESVFSYANVPYEIKRYEEIVANPKSTILYNWNKSHEVDDRVKQLGSDGKLMLVRVPPDLYPPSSSHLPPEPQVYVVNLAEKLLVAMLSKLSNLVVDGGIWLNTQRPEWNDANNALVGTGISMVTLYYLNRYVSFLLQLFEYHSTTIDPEKGQQHSFPISTEVCEWFGAIRNVLEKYDRHVERGAGGELPEEVSPVVRRLILDELGRAFSEYRWDLYLAGGFKAVNNLSGSLTCYSIIRFLQLAQKYLIHTIHYNKRKDGLFHAYNLLSLGPGCADVRYLYEMAEGQVSALSSGYLDPEQSCGLLRSMYGSTMYRTDQRSFMLYPNRQLKAFMTKNVIPEEHLDTPAMKYVLKHAELGACIATKDASGTYRFNAAFTNAEDLAKEVDRLAKLPASDDPPLPGSQEPPQLKYPDLAVLKFELMSIYEEVFDHQAFTGRSGTMFMYEGLGCIYWHMVAKLLLATQESAHQAFLQWQSQAGSEQAKLVSELIQRYYSIREGLGGFNKTPQVYGAFPSDPYSHSPLHLGAQQPGMTGVKEEVLTRWGELGVIIRNGCLTFEPYLLRKLEFLTSESVFEYVDYAGNFQKLTLRPGQLGFTICQVPIVYTMGVVSKMDVYHYYDPKENPCAIRTDRFPDTMVVPPNMSSEVFRRTGRIHRIDVEIPDSKILAIDK